MPLDLVLNVAVGGVLTGLVYGFMALGLSVIFGVIRIVNFAHGEMTAAAMYGAVLLFATVKLDPLLAVVPVAAALGLVGYALQTTLINPFIDRPEHSQFLLMLAVAIVLVNGLLMIFGPNAQNVMVGYAFDSYALGPLLVDATRVYAGAGAVLLSGLLVAFFRFTRTGKAIRACADNRLGAQIVGLPVKRLYALTFALGSACLGAAGCLLVLMIDVSPPLGPAMTLLAFVIVIVGGLGSTAGALLGGVIIGLSEALAGLVVPPSAKSMVSFAILILVLLFRPAGLVGRRA
jgi:branched-chain amino acid transport system permease protein